MWPSDTGGVLGEGSPLGRRRQVTIVVPTRNERDNVAPLVARVATAVADVDAEIVFVDDSDDDTPDVVVGAATHSPIPVRLIHRQPDERTGGLGGAVKVGVEATDSEWIVVMDGDLQHPPEVIPQLVECGTARKLDVVVASRYCQGGQSTGLSSATRQLVSSGAGALARSLFPRRLSDVTDPMSGFFAVRRAALDPQDLRPNGFKVLLEVLVRRHPGPVGEIPFVFADRHGGVSKASWREGVLYLRRLMGLRLSAIPGSNRAPVQSPVRPLAGAHVAPLPGSVP